MSEERMGGLLGRGVDGYRIFGAFESDNHRRKSEKCRR